MATITSRLPSRAVVNRANANDPVVRWMTAVTAVVSVLAFVYFSSKGVTLEYKDAISHLDIARRVIDGTTPGLAQLGGVWLPLPHLLTIPLIWIDALYYSGLAGSIISMLAYVATTVLLYKVTQSLTSNTLASIVAAAVFAFNPNVLYMQSTPMTELLLFACMAGMVYGVQQWAITAEHKYLLGAAVAGLMGTATRYEAWVLLVTMIVIVAVIGWRKKYDRTHIEGLTLAFLLIGAVGIAGWLLWNVLIFGDMLYFLIGDYAKPSLWVGTGEAAVGNWLVASLTYYYAVLENLWPAIAILMVVGVVTMAVKERLAPKILPILSLTVMVPFFISALEQGQRPLHVLQITNDLYNVRFGLLMILPAAVAIGYLIALVPQSKPTVFAASGLAFMVITSFTIASITADDKIVTLREPVAMKQNVNTDVLRETSQFLASNYKEGAILMESFGNDTIMFDAQIPLRNNVYEGSYRLWEPALQDPAGHDIQWIVMRHGGLFEPDRVYTDLSNQPALNSYDKVFENEGYVIYERSSS
ncbi:MAG TPA: glycosyltransferase family 39 protein [Candidatus Saccharimonadales bacterium]|jgi:hypothetical protein|nr:glycosyltransferase family 39 protein [Candidatus Saccharimonadales bacterium]